MEKSLVTIGIPFYNAEKFIATTIKSIINQTYTNFELILTDDGSTDNSVSIVKSFNDPRIKLISDGENKGISYRLNQQVNLAKGKYFFRMDADDIMFPNRLQIQTDFLDKNPEIDAVGSSVVVLDDENEIIAFREVKEVKDFKQLFNTILFNHPTVAGKVQFFKKFPYSEKLIGVEDADLWIRSFPTCKFGFLESPVLFYRDPLVFKLKTYKFRLNQKSKLFKQNEYLKEHNLLLQKLLLENNIKKHIASFLSFIKKDQYLISRRNDTNLTINKEWEVVLKHIVNDEKK